MSQGGLVGDRDSWSCEARRPLPALSGREEGFGRERTTAWPQGFKFTKSSLLPFFVLNASSSICTFEANCLFEGWPLILNPKQLIFSNVWKLEISVYFPYKLLYSFRDYINISSESTEACTFSRSTSIWEKLREERKSSRLWIVPLTVTFYAEFYAK